MNSNYFPATIRMSETDREAFLSEPHTGVFSFNEANEAPLSAPMWYRYEPGHDSYWFLTPLGSRKEQLIDKDVPVTLVVHEENPRPRYIVVRGRVSQSATATDADRLAVSKRYARNAGMSAEDLAASLFPGDWVIVRVKIGQWLTADFSKGLTR